MIPISIDNAIKVLVRTLKENHCFDIYLHNQRKYFHKYHFDKYDDIRTFIVRQMHNSYATWTYSFNVLLMSDLFYKGNTKEMEKLDDINDDNVDIFVKLNKLRRKKRKENRLRDINK